MAKDVLSIAWRSMCCRHFSQAIDYLNGKAELYENDFEYYIMLATAYLYVGDVGSASTYFQRARRIKLTDTRLLLGQAIVFLKRGDTNRALQYYLEIEDVDPGNKIAPMAVEFIKVSGDYDTICRSFDTGEIEKFYPPLGKNPYRVLYTVLPIAAFVLGCVLTLMYIPKTQFKGQRADLSTLLLTQSEKENAQEKDLSAQAFNYILTSRQISRCYNDAVNYFQSHRDNYSQIEINRLLNSNASVSIKQKAQVLMSYLEEPGFDTLTDNLNYRQVEQEPLLYLDCWVVWSGRITNAVVNADGSYSCQLLVGYENMKDVDGIVTVTFPKEPSMQQDQAVKILGKISERDGKLLILGKSIYQSVKKS